MSERDTGAKTSEPKTIVTVQDLRAARLCFQGSRPWLARHGFRWREFLADGIDAELLEATGDALALRVVAEARARMAREAREAREDSCDG